MTRILLACFMVLAVSAAVGGCRAEIDADDHAAVGLPR
jgi:hypothetical protein